MAITKSRKQARKLHRKRTRRYKRRGGQVTPLSDISTNSSMHDLDLDLDLDEPSNNTTSESMLSDSTTTPLASTPAATNLLGQFNAAHDESLNLSNNTTAASDASSENSFSDVATSFSGIGHGGKRTRRIRRISRTRRHKKSRKSRRHRRR